ncbi:MAPEG family protein [Pseudoalteromonas aurantia]|uniref:MAPEG family protein n=1 Tax=Pseudoalteromonas aurantia 208 TaxID=1314867 RepID=A0ABR9EJR9_9GAMM|nr:MAPEG family protein [Pseudoalteromonas aurantia]MBE0371077.1 hypothetical protein [Pseudoalteromonas aurantia 208]
MQHTPLLLVIFAMFGQTLLTLLVMFIMGKRRFKAAKNKLVDKNAFKTMDLTTAPEDVIVAGRNFSNQFEIPMLFFVVCVLAIALNKVSWVFALGAVLFVISRLVHSYIHLSTNHVLMRYRTFLIGCVFLIIQWAAIIFTLL